MRALRLTLGDVIFQWKYGFYAIYAIFTLVYLLVLSAVTASSRPVVAAVMIFADPAAMGLFFMGAIVLLEKSQRVNCALAVSPVRDMEYCVAKLLSLAAIGVLVAVILAITGGIADIVCCLLGVVTMSVLCSACGLFVAMKSRSLNQFVIFAVPFELFLCVPPALLLFDIESPFMMAHPGVAAIWLICGEAPNKVLCVLSLLIWCVPALLLCMRAVKQSFSMMGGDDA